MVISGKFHAKKHYDQLLFPQKKKKFRPTSENGRFRDFETEAETPFENRKFFFLKIYLTRIVFWGEIHRELPCHWNHYKTIS